MTRAPPSAIQRPSTHHILCKKILSTPKLWAKKQIKNDEYRHLELISSGYFEIDFEVRNNVVLDSVSRNDLIHTFLSRQLRFLGHLLRLLYALYEHTYGKTRRGQPRTNYITYIQKIIECATVPLAHANQLPPVASQPIGEGGQSPGNPSC